MCISSHEGPLRHERCLALSRSPANRNRGASWSDRRIADPSFTDGLRVEPVSLSAPSRLYRRRLSHRLRIGISPRTRFLRLIGPRLSDAKAITHLLSIQSQPQLDAALLKAVRPSISVNRRAPQKESKMSALPSLLLEFTDAIGCFGPRRLGDHQRPLNIKPKTENSQR